MNKIREDLIRILRASNFIRKHEQKTKDGYRISGECISLIVLEDFLDDLIEVVKETTNKENGEMTTTKNIENLKKVGMSDKQISELLEKGK